MAQEERKVLEQIASEMGAVAPEEMKDTELIDWITK